MGLPLSIWKNVIKRVLSSQVIELDKLPYTTAFYIGLFQVLALLPGTSRSGATIVGGLLNGTSRSVVTEFTFYLGIPVMFGASALKIFQIFESRTALELWTIVLALGCDGESLLQSAWWLFAF